MNTVLIVLIVCAVQVGIIWASIRLGIALAFDSINQLLGNKKTVGKSQKK